jgi:Ca-activated chloride channel family protein
LVGYNARIRRPLSWFVVAGVVFMAVAFAQPRWGKAWREVERGSRDILVLLDTSESMNAQNPLPNRLERARQKIESMMELCPGDRFGLIAFSGEAVLQTPLTLDHGYFRSILRVIDTDTLTAEGTDIAAALREAEKVFAEEDAEEGQGNRYNRAVLLISDGEQVSGDAVKASERLSSIAGVHVLGIGDPRGAEVTFPAWMRRHVRGQDAGKPHLSKLDEKTLSEIAVQGKGVYVRSTPSNNDIAHVHSEWAALASREVSSELRFNMVNRYRWPLAIAVFCFFAEGVWVVVMPYLRHRKIAKTGATLSETGHA